METFEQFRITLLTAEGFMRTAEDILHRHNLALELPKFGSPYIINLSLAIELYMKAVLNKEKIKFNYKQGHDLYELYKLIPQTTKDDIKSNYFGEIPLEDFFREHPAIFVKYRYPYEINQYSHLPQNSFYEAASALNKVCVTMYNKEAKSDAD